MPSDGLYDPEVQQVADDTGSTYGEAQDAKEDSGDTQPSQEAIDQIGRRAIDDWKDSQKN